MSLVQTIIVEGLRGLVRIVAFVFAGKDRRTVVLERRARALRLFKDLAAVGLRPNDLKEIERVLTEEKENRRAPTIQDGSG